MYDYFKTIIEKNSCVENGACAIHPSISSLYEFLLYEVKEISFYLVKLKEFGFVNQNATNICLETLSIFLINTNFNQKKYLKLFSNLYELKKEIKNKYIKYCAENKFPCEIINNEYDFEGKIKISDLIKYAELHIANKQKNCDKTKQKLYELITIFARLCAINLTKIKTYESNFNDYDFEIIRFFALSMSYSIRNEKLLRRIKEFSNISLKIREKLFNIYSEKYGKKENINVQTSSDEGHCILVSGNDLNELENLLNALETANVQEKINVYTNGTMFMAHFYPFFKNNKFLKGHYGSNNIQYEFSTFPGPILITKNFIQKIDNLYRGEIFSNKTISFEKVNDINNQNYMPVIESSQKLNGFLKNEEKENLELAYSINEINEYLKKFEEKEIVFIIGRNETATKIEEYENKKIINLSCPCETDILIDTIKILKEKEIKTTIFLTHCNLESLEVIFSLLNESFELFIRDCYYVLINPHVIECLKENFNVNII